MKYINEYNTFFVDEWSMYLRKIVNNIIFKNDY